MAEPAHRRLDDARRHQRTSNILDTGAECLPRAHGRRIRAMSRSSFRSERHIVHAAIIYAIEKPSRAAGRTGRSLFKRRRPAATSTRTTATCAAACRELDLDRPQPLSRSPSTACSSTSRSPALREKLGRYGKASKSCDDGRLTVEFSAEADGELMPGNRYRIVDPASEKSASSGRFEALDCAGHPVAAGTTTW